MVSREMYMQQGLDIRRLVLVLGRKLWLVLTGLLVGALLGGCVYKVVTGITNGHPEYRASSEYYISFNFGEFEHGDDYFNAYTWDGILRGDSIVDYAMTLLPKEVTKDMVREAVSGEMLGDYRILTVHVTTDSRELTDRITEAYHASMVHFGETIDMLDHIEVWSRGETLPLEKNTKTANAAFLGGIIGGLSALFALLVYYVMEDAVYVEQDVIRRFGLPVLGMLTKKGNEVQERSYRENKEFLFGDKKIENWNVEDTPTHEDYEKFRRADGVMLTIPWGRNNGAQTQRMLEWMKLQQCKVVGFTIEGAEDSFVKVYYGLGRKPSEWRKE